MIWIRADGNSEIGTGHIMRCLSIAAALIEQGKEVCFVTADEEPTALLIKRNQQFRVLHTDYRDMEAELPILLPILQKEQPELVLFDSYFVTDKYLQEIGKYTRTAYIDDKCLAAYPVDTIINYNIYGNASVYEGLDACEEMSVCEEMSAFENMSGERISIFHRKRNYLMGTAYAPLREEFQNIPYIVRPRAQNVLITTGGSDKYNLAGQILRAALSASITGSTTSADTCVTAESHTGVSSLQYHVVSGVFNKNFPELKILEETYPNVHIHQNVTEMAKLMQECDIAVSAGGSTMYELCAVGVPIICFSFVDNQEQIVEAFVQKGLVIYGGNYLTEKEALVENVVKNMRSLVTDKEKRAYYSGMERKLADGMGAMRIAKALCGN